MAAIANGLFCLLTALVPAPKGLPVERGFTAQTSEEFQKTFDEMNNAGWRLKRIKGYEKDGESRYDSEWHKPTDPPRFWCHHGLNRERYEQRTAQLQSDGYRETLKSTWKVKGEEFFWVVWELATSP